MTEYLSRMPIYDGINPPRPVPEHTCCSCPYCVPDKPMFTVTGPAFYNNATLTDPVLRHHANLSNVNPERCGFDDCPVCGAESERS